jgi:predicted nucleic acid-binding protein
MNKIFFDANILLDLLITNRANHAPALEVLPRIIERFETLATSEDILTTIEYIATRHRIPCAKTAAFFEMLHTQFRSSVSPPFWPKHCRPIPACVDRVRRSISRTLCSCDVPLRPDVMLF